MKDVQSSDKNLTKIGILFFLSVATGFLDQGIGLYAYTYIRKQEVV
jgi:hypothetical protein